MLSKGKTNEESRRIDYHRLIHSREKRKQSRRLYWRDLIKIEIATILSIAWFIQIELIRTKQVPPSITYTQMQKFPLFQKEVANKASTVYNDM